MAWKHDPHPILASGVPADKGAFPAHAVDVAKSLSNGQRILVHCSDVIGGTGMYAVAVVRKPGIPLADATKLIRDERSSPERSEQRALLSAPVG